MGVIKTIDKILSYLEFAKSEKKQAIDRQAPQAQKVQQATQQIISEDIKRRREEIRLAREQIENNSNPSKTY
jgi:hypothetical protein